MRMRRAPILGLLCASAFLPPQLAWSSSKPLQETGPQSKSPTQPGSLVGESFHASLETDGGPLHFGLELEPQAGAKGFRAYLINDPERIPVEHVEWDGNSLTLEIPHYDSKIEARRQGGELRGTWSKVRGKDKLAVVGFRAVPTSKKGAHSKPIAARAPHLSKNIAGRWAVDFETDDLPAVGVFEQEKDSGLARGTFLTATGDYRFLSGSVEADELTLSCFDGAHAFLFKAQLLGDGSLKGDFYSGNWWHETWTAKRDEKAVVVDAFQQTSWVDRASLADIVFPDTQGKLRSLGDASFRGKAYLVQVFGSWCPNCHDEARYLVELHRRYKDRGLSIVGLAFELTGDFQRDAEQVEVFKERHGIEYPILVAGTADKKDATQALGLLDRVRSYPTTIFLTQEGYVRAIHSGFAGPATGEEHQHLRAEFEEQIETLLAEEPTRDAKLREALVATPWIATLDGQPRGEVHFEEDASGLLATRDNKASIPVRILGDAVYVGERVFRFDQGAGVLLDSTDFRKRLSPKGSPITPLFGTEPAPKALRKALMSGDAWVRREAIIAAAHQAPGLLHSLWRQLQEDESIETRIALIWASGFLRLESHAKELAQYLEHPNAALRRQTVRSLLNIAQDHAQVRRHLKGHESDPDPLIRQLLQR